jgi:uncharacterized membrane protein
MNVDRGALDTGTLVRLVLVLVVVWLALEVVGEVLGLLLAPLGALRPVVTLVVLVLVALYVLKRL